MQHVVVSLPDSPECQQLAGALREAGYRVSVTSDVAKALDVLQQEPAEALLVGALKDDTRVAEGCRAVRACPGSGELPLLGFVWNAGEVDARGRVLQAGADAFLAPAVPLHDLVRQLRALLRGSRRSALDRAETIQGQLEAVFNAMSDGVMVFDMKGNLVLLNHAQARINGFATREEMLQGLAGYAKSYELTTPSGESLPPDQWPVSRVTRGESLHRLELRGLRRDTGQSWYFEYSGEPVRDASGKQVLTVIVTRDITRQKVIEERLIEAKEIAERHRVEQEAIVNSMAEGLVVFDVHGNLLDMNPAALAIHRFKSVDAIRMHLGRFPELNVLYEIDGAALSLERWPISRALRGETFSNYEVEVRPTDGSPPWVGSYGGAPIFGPDGKMILAIVTLRDITAQKRSEEELRQKEAALARVNVELERKVEERTGKLRETVADLEHFSYTLAHDLRAPLRTMHAFGEILHRQHATQLDATGRDFLRRIVQAAGRMDALITDALDYSKVVRSEYALQPVDPQPLLTGIIESYPELHPPLAEIVIEGTLPPVQANRAGLTQCFSNLLTNAVKFMPSGVLPRVRIHAEMRGDRVRLWFDDNGIGIPPDQQARIFGMFERLSPRYPGTGVGLALVQKVVERMRGEVGVDSKVGEGSRFWLEFAPASAAE